MKKCNKCGGSGPFGLDRRGKDGLASRCKPCAALAVKNWRIKNSACGEGPDSDKKCTECGSRGPFYKQRGNKDGLTQKCRECCRKCRSKQRTTLRAYQVLRRRADPERARAKDKAEREKYRERRKANWDQWAYGLKSGDREAMFAAQGGACAICACRLEDGRNTVVDHDHITKKVRGLLCRPCNVSIARFKESGDRLRSAIVYLEKPVIVFPNVVASQRATTREDTNSSIVTL